MGVPKLGPRMFVFTKLFTIFMINILDGGLIDKVVGTTTFNITTFNKTTLGTMTISITI